MTTFAARRITLALIIGLVAPISSAVAQSSSTPYNTPTPNGVTGTDPVPPPPKSIGSVALPSFGTLAVSMLYLLHLG